MKRYANAALIYAATALAAGVFYREFTKFLGFTGKTTLSVLHPHYFVLGTVFCLLLLLLEKNFSFCDRAVSKIMIVYHVGLNITGLSFLTRGVLQALGTDLSSALSASISGIAGIGHALLGVCMILVLWKLRKAVR